MNTLNEELKYPLNSRMLTCPVQGKWTSFQLVDETGSGEPYAGLAYEVTDTEGFKYSGRLDATGSGRVDNHYAGPIALILDQKYQGHEQVYSFLQTREHYPLEITELQVRAEQTRYQNHFGSRTRSNPAQTEADAFYQVEVRQLVQHAAHLPPMVDCHFPVSSGASRLMREHGKQGVCLCSNKHNVLEVRPLRALRPLLSTDSAFCVLNLYQLALMATLSYCPFGQKPDEQPVTAEKVSFTLQPSSGNWFGDALAKFVELWKVGEEQLKAYYPLYEDVAYSKRLEIVPFDPALYPANNPALEARQEHPANIHFFDDRGKESDTDSQAFITHNDELILIAVRGTNEKIADGLRDADALQVPFEQGDAKVHRGFYDAAKNVYDFAIRYLDKFYAGQKLVICGHSLGGAITLLLSEMLRRRPELYDIVLYTYGAPRAADATFVKEAAALVHHRMVNHNDPVPSVPATWMNTKPKVYLPGAALTFVNVPLGLSVFVAGITNLNGEPYEHHGTLQHFMPVEFGGNRTSAILWQPGCDTIAQHAACSLAIKQVDGLPIRPGLLTQIFNAGNHSMVGGYIPACWATFRRWQEAQEQQRSLVTDEELKLVDGAMEKIDAQLRIKRKQLDNGSVYARSQQLAINALWREINALRTTRERLYLLSIYSKDEKDVYGSVSAHPERLAESLLRWNAHLENRVAEQLAMAPVDDTDESLLALIGEDTPGKPYTLDIDSIS
ncbi:lipase family protein [Pseudomonas alkylphenolica]|uniref:Lipase, class 3 n=1 Tax=Pseudomonas alkylphenolica TaxID=237609 RepID=A0A077F778_9PSED|nr:lipase family protein [Pseudomonas alkylphenolica]AIL61333.1 lipase, class 3 [Pseudomonas alkylphenolica]